MRKLRDDASDEKDQECKLSGIELDFDEDVKYEFDEKEQGCEMNETKRNEKEECEGVK